MRRRILVICVLATVLGAPVSQGDGVWRLKIHKGETVEVHALARIDSLTLEEEPLATPPMVTIPMGVFIMGDGSSYCGEYEHEVTLTRDFSLGQHEVTNLEYMEAVQWAYDSGYVNADMSSVWDNLDGSTVELLRLEAPACELAFDGGVFSLRDIGHGVNPENPVFQVTWYGAARFCDWHSLQWGLPRAYEHAGDWACNGGDPYGAMGYRLPTDAEWEYAAQFNDERTYPWGNETPSCSRANYVDCVGWTSPVGSYPDAPEELGLSDMAGNVYEWCNDWHVCELDTSPVIDPTGPDDGVDRALHGGGWDRGSADLPCALRGHRPPDFTIHHLGFRIARTVSVP